MFGPRNYTPSCIDILRHGLGLMQHITLATCVYLYLLYLTHYHAQESKCLQGPGNMHSCLDTCGVRDSTSSWLMRCQIARRNIHLNSCCPRPLPHIAYTRRVKTPWINSHSNSHSLRFARSRQYLETHQEPKENITRYPRKRQHIP